MNLNSLRCSGRIHHRVGHDGEAMFVVFVLDPIATSQSRPGNKREP